MHELLVRPCGDYQTNCYILRTPAGELIIDPGIGADAWVISEVKRPIAILNTHGHFDHVWSNAALQNHFGIPLATPEADLFLLSMDFYDLGLPPSTPDLLVKPDEVLDFSGITVRFHHFPGHTPGCSAIETEGVLFSGDFVFANSIGRSDFPYSDSRLMRQSLERFMAWERDLPLYPGHGSKSSVAVEQGNIPRWLRYV